MVRALVRENRSCRVEAGLWGATTGKVVAGLYRLSWRMRGPQVGSAPADSDEAAGYERAELRLR